MAHFAEIDENNIVKRVLVVDDKDILNSENIESEELGINYLKKTFGGTWLKTSYNTLHNTHASGDNSKAFRGNFSRIGYVYDDTRDIFREAQPYNSWIFDEDECKWKPPAGYPGGSGYYWDEPSVSWIKYVWKP